MIRVAVAGAAGRMGREVVRAVAIDPDCELVAALDVSHAGDDAGELAGTGPSGIAIGDCLNALADAACPEVLVDFTVAPAAAANARAALERGISPVIGTTGMPQAQVDQLAELAGRRGIGAFIAPNFAIGA